MSGEDRASPLPRGDWPGIARRALRHIEARIADPALSVAEVATAVGCSRATLYRAFTEHGTGVADLMRELRLRRASALLEQGSMGVAEVALACGLVDARTLQRLCKARFGVSPTELTRRRHS
ncbi:MAG TPA: helix-turn-helix transcriptional regulator [Caulobacteraceae bacterium]